MSLEKLYAITCGLNRRFPSGNHPFQIMTRLLEEGGELAQMVNHFEGTGTKLEKYGPPDKSRLAKEVLNLLRCSQQMVIYYGAESEVDAKINEAYERLRGRFH